MDLEIDRRCAHCGQVSSVRSLFSNDIKIIVQLRLQNDSASFVVKLGIVSSLNYCNIKNIVRIILTMRMSLLQHRLRHRRLLPLLPPHHRFLF